MAEDKKDIFPNGNESEQSETVLNHTGTLSNKGKRSVTQQKDSGLSQDETIGFLEHQRSENVREIFRQTNDSQRLHLETTEEKPHNLRKSNLSYRGENPSLKLSKIKYINGLSVGEKKALEDQRLSMTKEKESTETPESRVDRSSGTMENLYKSLFFPGELEAIDKKSTPQESKNRRAVNLSSAVNNEFGEKLNVENHSSIKSQGINRLKNGKLTIGGNPDLEKEEIFKVKQEVSGRRVVRSSNISLKNSTSSTVQSEGTNRFVQKSVEPLTSEAVTQVSASADKLQDNRSFSQSTNILNKKDKKVVVESNSVDSLLDSENSLIVSPLSRSSKFSPSKNSKTTSKEDSVPNQSRVDRIRALNEAAELEKHQKKHSRPETKKRNISRIVIGVVVLAVLAFLVGGYFYVNSNLKAVNAQNKTKQIVNIPYGSSTKQVANTLAKNRLVKNATIFEYYTKIKGLSNFRSGRYNLSQSMTPEQIARIIEGGGSEAAPSTGKIIIPAGDTIDQIAGAITINASSSKENSEKTPFNKAAFLKVVKDPSFIAEMQTKYPQLFANLPAADSGVKYQLEGYLCPSTYNYSNKTSVRDIVEQMISKMNQTMKSYYGDLGAKGLSVNDLLTLASLVEKEASKQSDRQNIAEVFLNCLNQDLPLQSNAALLYAENKLGSASTSDSAEMDTNIDSPYNLYTNTGMGPGPVDSPSKAAIESVLNHTRNDNLYFVVDPKTKKVYFADSMTQQNENIATYVTPNNP